MAERRMFAKTIIDSDLFLDMPQSTQLLYFHLAMHGDDDGFINNPKSIMRNAGCRDDDMKLLMAKQFIIPFDSGVVVIKHWKIHNYIRSDRYSETKCISEKAKIQTLETKEYQLIPAESGIPPGIPTVDERFPQVRLGEDRLGKDSIEVGGEPEKKRKSKTFSPPTLEEVQAYAKEKGYIVDTEYFFEFFETGNWIDSKGNKVKNWKQKLLTWNKKELEKRGNGANRNLTGTAKGEADKRRGYQYPEESLPDFLA